MSVGDAVPKLFSRATLEAPAIAKGVSVRLSYHTDVQGRIKHLVGPTHFTVAGPQPLCG